MTNNKTERQKLAIEIKQLEYKLKQLKKSKDEICEKLIKMMNHRKIDKEQYENGITATIVRNNNVQIDKEKFATNLGLSKEEFLEIWERSTSTKPKKPYLLIK